MRIGISSCKTLIVSNRLRSARNEAGLTQKQVAEFMGIDPNTVSAYERGTIKPREHSLRLMALLYGKNVDWLRGSPDAEESPEELLVSLVQNEWSHLRKFRVLSEEGQNAIDGVVEVMLRQARGQR